MPYRHLPASVLGDPKRARRLYRSQNSIWLWLGVAAVLGSVAYFIDSASAENSAAGRLLSGWIEVVYYTMLGLGGGIIFLGVWKLDARTEIIGHLCVGMAVFITSLSILISVGGAAVSGLTLLGVACANVSRIYYLWSIAPRKDDNNGPG